MRNKWKVSKQKSLIISWNEEILISTGKLSHGALRRRINQRVHIGKLRVKIYGASETTVVCDVNLHACYALSPFHRQPFDSDAIFAAGGQQAGIMKFAQIQYIDTVDSLFADCNNSLACRRALLRYFLIAENWMFVHFASEIDTNGRQQQVSSILSTCVCSSS